VPKWIPTKRCVEDMLYWLGYDEVQELDEDEERSLYFVRRTSAGRPAPQ
jgi:hypothetical protein